MTRPSVATLAIGTEITDGQIVNRNSSWIAQQLTDYGFIINEHRSTPDDRPLMLKALKELTDRNDYLFVTGGLGPTSDDFTRDVVAEFLGLPLVFDEASWKQVTEHLNKRAVPVRESQRHQCEFPQGAEVLVNTAGTANGFYIESAQKKIYVLPGPPHEIAAIWETAIAPKLQSLIPETEKERLFLFRCIGKGESEFADITEKKFASVKEARLGYRAHAPYVEIKVWVHVQNLEKVQPIIDELHAELAPYLVNRDREDLVTDLLDWLEAGHALRVIDLASGGLLAERILTRARETKRLEKNYGLTMATELRLPQIPQGATANFTSAANASEAVLVLAVAAETSEFLVGISSSGQSEEATISVPFRLKPESERARKFLVEKALQVFRDTVISRQLS